MFGREDPDFSVVVVNLVAAEILRVRSGRATDDKRRRRGEGEEWSSHEDPVRFFRGRKRQRHLFSGERVVAMALCGSSRQHITLGTDRQSEIEEGLCGAAQQYATAVTGQSR